MDARWCLVGLEGGPEQRQQRAFSCAIVAHQNGHAIFEGYREARGEVPEGLLEVNILDKHVLGGPFGRGAFGECVTGLSAGKPQCNP